MSVNAGCVAEGTPEVEIVLIHLDVVDARDCTPPNVEAVGFGNCVAAIVPEISLKAGCVEEGTPKVLMELIHCEVVAALLCTPPNVLAEGFGKPDARTEVAVIVPVPVASKLAPVPTCITADALVPDVMVLNAAEPAVPPEVPQLKPWLAVL